MVIFWLEIFGGISDEWIYQACIGRDRAAAYAAAILRKGLRLRRSLRSPEAALLRFEVIRLAVDCGLLCCFLLTDLFPLWFGLFSDTALGYCTGSLDLISATLLVSIFIDWVPVRKSYLREGNDTPSFARFFLRQVVNIIQIEFVLVAVWCVFLVLEPTRTGLWIKLALSALMLLVFRGLLWLARGFVKKDPS